MRWECNEGGFSLIELIGVMAIMSLVAGGVVVFGSSMMSVARLTETTAMSDSLMREAHMVAKYQKLCTKVSYNESGSGSSTLTLSSTASATNCCSGGNWTQINQLDLRDVRIQGLAKDLCFNEDAVIDERKDRELSFVSSVSESSKVVKVFWLTGKVMSK